MDADPHHEGANHGMLHSGLMEKGRHHQQSISWNYDLRFCPQVSNKLNEYNYFCKCYKFTVQSEEDTKSNIQNEA